MKRGIKAKLFATFVIMNTVFLLGTVGVAFTNNYTVNQYSDVISTLSVGYQLNEGMDQLISTYNQLVLSNSAILAANNTQITSITDRVDQEVKYLNDVVVDPQAKSSFTGLKNSIDKVIEEVQAGLKDVSQDKPTALSHYQAAQRFYDFVQTNSTSFTFDQLRYINSIKENLKVTYLRLEVVAGALLLIAAVTTAWYGFQVARRIVNPLSKLTDVATNVAAGKMDIVFDKSLLARTDEIGSLSVSFNTMFQRLKGKIRELEHEKAVSESQRAKDEAILSSIGDGMIVTDSVGRVLLLNAASADLLDLDTTHIIGKPVIDAFTLYDDDNTVIPSARRPLYLAIHQAKKNVQNVRFTKRNGTRLALQLTATPVVQQGAIVGCIEIVRNITQEKEIDRMKTEFISLASHQLRTPLSAIKWFSEMLLSGDAGALTVDQKDFTQNIADSTDRMVALVNSLLNISRMESGRIIIEPRPTDLHQLVQSIVTDLGPRAGQRKQKIMIQVSDDLPRVSLDPRLIGQVYLNLLTNAIKYTPEGGEIKVIVAAKGNDIVSQIADNGYGIPKIEQPKMFKKFFRASNILKVETDGTGLGMYLVKAIIESGGGKIWFESEENKGTTFWFTIPLSGMKAKTGEVTLDVYS